MKHITEMKKAVFHACYLYKKVSLEIFLCGFNFADSLISKILARIIFHGYDPNPRSPIRVKINPLKVIR